MKRLGLMVCSEYPDIRCGRITTALANVGWEHDVLTRGFPPQMTECYRNIDWGAYRDAEYFTARLKCHTEAEVIHVHGELDGFWPVLCRDSRPTILNVHDLKCARVNAPLDPKEAESLEAADAHIWVSEQQRDFAKEVGLCTDKPYAVISNYASSSVFIEKTPLPHIGGVCYEGCIAPRGEIGSDRDFSPVADALGGALHTYGNGPPFDYGIQHPVQLIYPLLIHRLAQHDWGFAGYHTPVPSWMQSFPTKASEYWAAGIPIIAMNTPLLRPFCEQGMGVYITDLKELAHLPDPKPYRKAVLANRGRYTTESQIHTVAKLYEELT